MLRLLLVIVLLHGLVPSLGEAVEFVVHYATSGHLAHFEPGEKDLDTGNKEHGCGPVAHHCGCCASQSVLPTQVASATPPLPPSGDGAILGPTQRLALGAYRRLLRPPIAA
ncbi:hypothetical protein [Pyxidicoccus sp. MSG2]|uniref:hypothetical protein n=1 Tax=Pyxidicoccus sp. MSG2 TaxID=2996790 RepID=UPI00226D5EB9|nr:hypothetical protein [Pyxidicoccus sp. MSG2]MCY1017882.1 hypothetical protein [Pyxidicoccus sp. MSG2]